MFIKFLISLFVFIFGLCIGSFLNCVVYRLEKKEKITGRSFCPQCKTKLSWSDLFPVFSFLFLLGRCRYCRKKISIQYPIVEIATGLVFLLIFSAGVPTGSGPALGWNLLNLAFLFYIASVLIVIFVYDLRYYLIPDRILFPAIAIGATYRIFENLYSLGGLISFVYAVLIGAGFFLFIFLISKGRWMGFGDVKLAVLMGLILGLPSVFPALFLAFFFGAIIGIITMIFGNKSLKSEMPFAPFLITGTFIAVLYGGHIIQWYLTFFQI